MLDLLTQLPAAGPIAAAGGRRATGSGFAAALGNLASEAAQARPVGGGATPPPVRAEPLAPGQEFLRLAGPAEQQGADPALAAAGGPPLETPTTALEAVDPLGQAPAVDAGWGASSASGASSVPVPGGSGPTRGAPPEEPAGLQVHDQTSDEEAVTVVLAAAQFLPERLAHASAATAGQGASEPAVAAGEASALRGLRGTAGPVRTPQGFPADSADRPIWPAPPQAAAPQLRGPAGLAAGPAPSAPSAPALSASQSSIPAVAPQEPAAADLGFDVPAELSGMSRSGDRAPSAQDPSAAPQRPPGSPAAAQIEVHLARAAHGRVDRLVVQLEPMDLGKVEIRLEFGDEGRVGAIISAERPETLEALQRDAQALERSLRDAGLRPDGGGLSFDLKRGSGDGGKSGSGEPAPEAGGMPAPDQTPSAAGEVRSVRLLDIQA